MCNKSERWGRISPEIVQKHQNEPECWRNAYAQIAGKLAQVNPQEDLVYLTGWRNEDDAAFKEFMWNAEQDDCMDAQYLGDRPQFDDDWSRGEYEASAAIALTLDDVELLEQGESDMIDVANTLRAFVHRDGVEQLIEWLESSDFHTAPASTRFHAARRGGLIAHSLNVYQELCKEYRGRSGKNPDKETRESMAIVGLLHDACKIGLYVEGFRNKKDEKTGQWERTPCWTRSKAFCYGHGEKSVYMIQKYIKLTDAEAQAIRYHMGAFVGEDQRDLAAVYSGNRLAYDLHVADCRASYYDDDPAPAGGVC